MKPFRFKNESEAKLFRVSIERASFFQIMQIINYTFDSRLIPRLPLFLLRPCRPILVIKLFSNFSTVSFVIELIVRLICSRGQVEPILWNISPIFIIPNFNFSALAKRHHVLWYIISTNSYPMIYIPFLTIN